MAPDPAAYRQAMSCFATGVTVVTTLDGNRPWGVTVNALSSVSLEPPVLMIALDRKRKIAPVIRAVGRYAVNVLAEDDEDISDCFAGAPVAPNRDAFCGVSWTPGDFGMPLLKNAIASLECTVVEIHPVGDHELFIGRVESVATERDNPLPLLYYRRHYLRIEKAEPHDLVGKPE